MRGTRSRLFGQRLAGLPTHCLLRQPKMFNIHGVEFLSQPLAGRRNLFGPAGQSRKSDKNNEQLEASWYDYVSFFRTSYGLRQIMLHRIPPQASGNDRKTIAVPRGIPDALQGKFLIVPFYIALATSIPIDIDGISGEMSPF